MKKAKRSAKAGHAPTPLVVPKKAKGPARAGPAPTPPVVPKKAKGPAKAAAQKSAKARSAANLDPTRKLHRILAVPSTGKGEAASKLPNRILGQGKRRVWLGDKEAQELLAACKRPKPHEVYSGQKAFPQVESLRGKKMAQLRKGFLDLCRSSGSAPPPVLALERWLMNSLTTTSAGKAAAGKDAAAPAADPVFPGRAAAAGASAQLVADLVHGSMPTEAAKTVSKKLAEHSARIVAEVAQAAAKEQERAKVVVAEHRHSMDVHLKGKGKYLLKLNHEHHAKLKALWQLHQGVPDVPAGGKAERRFHAALFVMLTRYHSIQGPGFQAACSEHVQEVLRADLSVSHECFASPLNCYFPTFCSAFPDTDAAFGSQGSFWTWSYDASAGGSFQVNPPFVADVLLATARRLGALLAESEGSAAPLSFVVIVPGWLEDAGVKALTASRFKRFELQVAKADHGFCDGAQHQRQDRYRESPYDSIVLVLQNKQGAARWPVAGGLKGKLLDAFAMARPTASAIERRRKEGRGFADQDGGGGVYKGKKRKRGDDGAAPKRKKRKRADGDGAPAKKWKKKTRGRHKKEGAAGQGGGAPPAKKGAGQSGGAPPAKKGSGPGQAQGEAPRPHDAAPATRHKIRWRDLLRREPGPDGRSGRKHKTSPVAA